jgi:hypothetical protein
MLNPTLKKLLKGSSANSRPAEPKFGIGSVFGAFNRPKPLYYLGLTPAQVTAALQALNFPPLPLAPTPTPWNPSGGEQLVLFLGICAGITVVFYIWRFFFPVKTPTPEQIAEIIRDLCDEIPGLREELWELNKRYKNGVPIPELEIQFEEIIDRLPGLRDKLLSRTNALMGYSDPAANSIPGSVEPSSSPSSGPELVDVNSLSIDPILEMLELARPYYGLAGLLAVSFLLCVTLFRFISLEPPNRGSKSEKE